MIILGDTHANWKNLNNIIQLVNEISYEENIIICGDFGYWPKFWEKYPHFNLSNIDTHGNTLKFYFCPGNHEDWWSLPKTNEIIEIYKNIYYCPFGSTKVIEDKTIMFCGGADSIDKHLRQVGIDWFPEEVISYSDMENLPAKDTKIDIVISHTCPRLVLDKFRVSWMLNKKVKDPSCIMLDYVLETYQPDRWFFGHFHTYASFVHNKTLFSCLDEITSPHCTTKL